jgi:hypothetical protein
MQPSLVSNGQNSEALVLLKTISPVAWQQVHFHGHYTFCGSRNPVDLDVTAANLTRKAGNKGYQRLWIRSDQVQKCHGKLPDENSGGLGLQPLVVFEEPDQPRWRHPLFHLPL